MLINVQLPPGEIIDRLTILELKRHFISDAEKLVRIDREHAVYQQKHDVILDHIRGKSDIIAELAQLEKDLHEVNHKLWHIEDEIRDHERQKLFNERFIELARSVYRTNDKRSELKSAINKLLNSEFNDEKSYHKY